MAQFKIIKAGYYEAGTGKSIPNDPKNSDYQRVQDWLAAGNTPDPADPAPDPMIEVRAERDRRIVECDWTQLADSPLPQAEKDKHTLYRQALRDLPANQPDATIDTVVWPNG